MNFTDYLVNIDLSVERTYLTKRLHSTSICIIYLQSNGQRLHDGNHQINHNNIDFNLETLCIAAILYTRTKY